MADFETKLRWLSERGDPVGAEELIERIEADLAGELLVVVNNRREGTLRTQTEQIANVSHARRYRGPAWAVTTFVAILAVAGIYLAISGDSDRVAEPTPTTIAESVPTTEVAVPSWEANVTQLLNDFLAARIAGEGAEEYLSISGDTTDYCCNTPPLLYATTSGVAYDRAEFEPVPDIEWPYGYAAFKVRLFAGDTVVEQLFFTPHDDPTNFPADGRLPLVYNSYGFGTEIAPTTEDGQPVAAPYNLFNGEVTMRVAHPWVISAYSPGGGRVFGRLIPDNQVEPTTDGGQRTDWDELILIADPALAGPGCDRPGPVDVATLVENIRSIPGLEATAPVAVNAGGAEGLMMDVVIRGAVTFAVDAQYNPCANGLLNLVLNQDGGSSITVVTEGVMRGSATGDWMRLYLFDMPEGLSMRILSLAIVAPESRFEATVEAAAPIVSSIELHAP